MTHYKRLTGKWNNRLLVGLIIALAALLIGLISARADTAPAGILSGACALKPNGGVDCWPGSDFDQNGPYTFVSRGTPVCAVRVNSDIDCWGDNTYGQANDQAGPFIQASAGSWHSCGLRPNGSATCWGSNEFGQADPQAGPYSMLSLGLFHTCGLKTDGVVDCWGLNGNGQAGDHDGPYTHVDAGLLYTCAILATGYIDCWGDNFYGEGDDHTGTYVQVSADWRHTCALKPDGGVDCWGFNDDGESESQLGTYTWVTTASNYTCALKLDGSVDCWGNPAIEDQPGPYGPYDPDSNPNTYTFTGFFPPIANPPALNRAGAGQIISIKFSLGGDFGLDVFAAGYPVSRPVNCKTSAPIGSDEPAIPANNGLRYSALSGTYTYPWGTADNWHNCRELVVRFNDGQEFTALFRFRNADNRIVDYVDDAADDQ